MPAPPAENGGARSELQDLQLKSQQVTDEVGFHRNSHEKTTTRPSFDTPSLALHHLLCVSRKKPHGVPT